MNERVVVPAVVFFALIQVALPLAVSAQSGFTSREKPVAASSLAVSSKGSAPDTAKSDELIKRLEAISEKEWPALYQDFYAHADEYQPFALYAVAHALLKFGKREESAFWYSLGRLRASFDAARCSDPSVRQVLGFLDHKYPELGINLKCKYDRIHESLTLALTWDQKRPALYDHRWVYAFAQSARLGGELSKPESLWNQIRQNTQNELASTIRSLESQGRSRWEAKQRSSAQRGLIDYEASRKKAEAENNTQLERVLERLKVKRDALDACVKE